MLPTNQTLLLSISSFFSSFFHSIHKLPLLAFLCLSGLFTACESSSNSSHNPKVALFVPAHHEALYQIEDGFRKTLEGHYEVEVFNAMGSIPNLYSLLKQVRPGDYSFIAGVGTKTSQMLIQNHSQEKIVAVAALIDKEQKTDSTLFVVDDEADQEEWLRSLEPLLKERKKLVLVHSNTDKIHEEVKLALESAKRLGLSLESLMVEKIADLPRIQSSLESYDGVLVLKDHEIVTGMPLLAKMSHERGLLVFTSDEGSIAKGADFGYGVEERQTGVQAAEMILKHGTFKGRKNEVVNPKKFFVNHLVNETMRERINKTSTAQNIAIKVIS